MRFFKFWDDCNILGMQPKSIKSANGMHSEKIKNFSCIPKVKNAQRDDFETELKEKYWEKTCK